MINREICADCPNRAKLPFGKLKKFIARQVLGPDFIADGCAGGPFLKQMTTESYSALDALVGGRVVEVVWGCSQDEPPAEPIEIFRAGSEIVVTQGAIIIEHTRDGKPVW